MRGDSGDARALAGDLRHVRADRRVEVERLLGGHLRGGCGGHHLRDGAHAEERLLGDGAPGLDVGDAEALGVRDLAVDHHGDLCTWRARARELGGDQ